MFVLHLASIVTGHQNNRDIGIKLANLHHQIGAVQLRHDNIRHQQVDILLVGHEHLQGSLPVDRLQNLIAEALQH